jgi:hypothetical protein
MAEPTGLNGGDGLGEEPQAAAGEDRVARVRRAIGIWRKQLIDLGARNNLLYFRDLRQGTISFDDAEPRVVNELLARRKVRLSRLFPDSITAQAKRARTIRKKAQELFEERGLETLYLACGLATWETAEPGRTPCAPVLLAPIRLTPRGGTQDDFDLDISGELEVNPTLLHLLETDFKVVCSPEELLSHTEIEGAIDTPAELGAVYRWLEQHASSNVPGFHVDERLVLGTFAYAKLPMVNDLGASEEALIEHELIAAIAGDPQAREAVRGRISEVDATEPNRIPPADEFLILDADSSQNWAINACLAGQDLIVRGPPGTGKSQTIANLIATLIARDKRVLFVAEKRAAIDAVLGRIDACGLSDLVLDLHGGTGSKKRLAQSLKETLEAHANQTLPRLEERHADLAARRDQLNRRAEALHRVREPWEVSIYEVQAELLGLDDTADVQERFGETVLKRLTRSAYLEAREELRQWASLGGSTQPSSDSPWKRAEIVSADDARSAFELVGRISDSTLPNAERALAEAAAAIAQPDGLSVASWRAFVSLCERARQLLSRFDAGLFERDLKADALALAPAGKGFASRVFAQVGSGDYRRSKSAIAALAQGTDVPASDLLVGCEEAQQLLEDWRQRSGNLSGPAAPSNLDSLSAILAQLEEELAKLGRMAGHDGLENMSLDEVRSLLSALRVDQATLFKLPELHRLRLALLGKGLEGLLARIEARAMPAESAVVALERAWLSSIYEYIAPGEPEIGAFDGQGHLATVEAYRAADRAHIESTAVRVRRAAAERATKARDDYPDEASLVSMQAARRIGHKPVREMFALAPHVIGALKPCWVMSPLVVSQLLPPAEGEPPFDVVIFDEASQITQPDAIPAILRGRRVIVAGDELQLPPTNFFAASDPQSEEEQEEETAGLDHALAATEGFESILATLDGLVSSRMLLWHYRSRDERLIAFSNANLYDRSLTTFPGISGDDCLTHQLIPFSPPLADETLSVSAEVQRVVELVLEHARTRPHESLGVIAMGIKHANRIDEALLQARRAAPELEDFFSEANDERFFVKNLERVQGDERDAIILTIGYGKDGTGRLPYRFGPLLYEGGHRRLNVAITRAKRRMTLVSSFAHTDMDPDRSKSDGVRLLRDYLEFAASGGTRLNASDIDKPPLNPFEIDVRDQLTRAGIPLIAQHGSSGFRIDFAAKHPDRPGELVLAIECDGASYHSSPTARDRDRLRQEQLERLNWRFHRIWSTDWFRNRDAEIARAVLAYNEAVADADARSNGSASQPPLRTSTSFTRPQAGRQEPQRGPRPNIPTEVRVRARNGGRPTTRRRRFDEYSQRELVDLVCWIKSDTRLRTEQELISLLLQELDFRQHRESYDAPIIEAIRIARERCPERGLGGSG